MGINLLWGGKIVVTGVDFRQVVQWFEGGQGHTQVVNAYINHSPLGGVARASPESGHGGVEAWTPLASGVSVSGR